MRAIALALEKEWKRSRVVILTGLLLASLLLCLLGVASPGFHHWLHHPDTDGGSLCSAPQAPLAGDEDACPEGDSSHPDGDCIIHWIAHGLLHVSVTLTPLYLPCSPSDPQPVLSLRSPTPLPWGIAWGRAPPTINL